MKNATKSMRLTTLLKISLLSCAIGLLSGTTEAAPPIFTSTFGSKGAGDGQFGFPQFIATNPATGTLYVTDPTSSRVEAFDTLGNYLFKFGSTGTGDGQFDRAVGVAFGNGNLYVTDSAFFVVPPPARVEFFDPNGNYLGQFGSLGGFPGQFNQPAGINIDSVGNVYVADSGNSRVQVFSPVGAFISQFGGASLVNPSDVVVDGVGNRYVTSTGTNNVQVFNSAGVLTNTFGGPGNGNGLFNGPAGIALGSGGNIYVADEANLRVQIFDSVGNYLSQFSTTVTPGAGPHGIMIEPNTGKIYTVITQTIGTNNALVQEWFDPAEWTQPGTSKLTQLPLNQALTLNNGFNLQVQSNLSLLPGGDVTINPGGTLSASSISLNGGSITDTASTTLTMPMILTTGTLIGNSPLTSANLFIYQGDISGGPGATLNIGGIGVVLTGNNTFTGNINILPGTGLLGTAASFNNNPIANPLGVPNGGLIFTQATDATHTGPITGGGNFGKIGAGNLTLTNPTNTFNLISNGQGTLTGNVSSLNAVAILTAGSARTVFDQATDASFGGSFFGGAGSFEKKGAGVLTLTNAANRFGSVTVTEGTLTGNTLTLNTPALTIASNGSLSLNQNTDATFGGAITSLGFFSKSGVGNLTLTNPANTFEFIENVQLGALTGTAATLNATTIRNLATLVLNQPTDATFGANILGQGTLVKQGAGNLTLTGDNDFSAQGGPPGQIIINEGTLTGNTGSINAPIITNNAALVFNQLNNGVFTGQISGPGSVSKIGPGTLTFTTTQTYNSPTTINQGTFTLNGGLPNSAISVAQGATIMGSGSMKSLAVNGIVAPGNSIGTLTVGTTFAMTPTATYQAEIDPSGASDLIAVGGTASLAGTLQVIGNNINQLKNQTFTILTAGGGVNGAFANLTSLNRLKYTVQYLQNAVKIHISPLQSFTDAFGPASSGNAARTAQYFETFANSVPPSSDLGGIIQTLDGMLAVGDTAGLKHAFSQIQPSQYRELGMLSFTNNELVSRTVQSQQQYLRETHRVDVELKELEGVPLKRAASFRQLVNDTLSKGFNFANASSPSGLRKASLGFMAPHGTEGSGMPGSQRIRFGDSSTWFQSYGQIHEKNSSHGNVGLRSQTGGMSLGGDHQVVKNVFVGLFGGMSTTPFNWKHSRGHGRMKSYYGGLYGTWMSDMGLYVDGQVIAGQDRFHSTRKIQFANINRRAKESHHGNQFSVDTEIGYAWGLPMMTVQPYIDASYMVVHENGFREKGAQSLNFRIKSKTSPFIRGAVGTQVYRTFVCGETILRPAVQLAYVRKQPLGHKNVKGGLVNQPQTLSVVGDNKVRNQFAPGVSLTAQFENGTYIIGNVSGQVFSGENSGEALVRIGYDF